MNKLIFTDRNDMNYEVKNLQRFSNYIFRVHGSGSSIHKEEDHYFVVDDEFKKKIKNFLSNNK